MAGVSWEFTPDGHTTPLGSDTGVDFTTTLRVRMDDCEDTGWEVLQYIRSEGFEFGSQYRTGNTNVNAWLYQADPPEKIENSDYLWLVTLHYSPKARKSPNNSEGAENPTEWFPTISVGTVARTTVVDKAFYRGGRNGPGGSPRATVDVQQR